MRAPLEPTTNNRPGLSIPPSAIKRSSALASRYRPSLAPSSNNFAPRQSVYGSQNINPLLLSASKLNSAPYGRTPSQSARRASQWGITGGRQSFAPTPMAMPHQISKDPRAYREKSVQQMMRSGILSVLQNTGFQGNATAKMLASPTAKEFRAIFEHFVSILDHGRKIKGKFEDEFVLIFKDFEYPFADSLDKKWLAAPASMHSWPSLVAALHWMANLVESFVQYTGGDDLTLQLIEQVPDDFDDPVQHAAIAFDFYAAAYGDFLDGKDDFSSRMDDPIERYSRKNQSIVEELDQLKSERDQLLAEYSRLSSEVDPAVALLTENRNLRDDKEKYDKTVEHWVRRKNKVASQVTQDQKRILEETANLQRLREELEQTSNEVKRQNLSDEEVVKMKADHELLVRTVEELKRKKEESGASARSLEIMLASRTESLEQAVDNYTALLEHIGLFPTVAPPYPPCDLRVEINFSSPNPSLLLRMEGDGKPVDVKRVIKPTLDTISEIKRRQIQELEERMLTIENELDTLTADYEREKQDLLSMENKIALLEKQARDTREAAQHETDISNKEAARLEEELASAKSAALSNGVGVRLRLQTLQIAYQEQEDRVKRLKEETIKAIMKNSNDIVNFKREVSDRLSYLQQVAEEG